ncbi:hypothetical protein HPB52_007537 [Rhipicephalus sanguineus]|uniref:Uncharacterized protein n=1 Tax=Rhipicephalus sanguineus TaxID=34632 RepID=A0A9D4PLH6_RHISA|nr:hypothetical protein HPB52_007537 [Rhipicephalus sanguineus]
MTEKTSVKEQFPAEACDFVVFMDLTYNGQEDKLVPKANVANDRFPTLHKMLQKFHESFKENRPRSLLLMFGIQVQNYRASPVELLQNLQKIVKVVDYTILETHHSRSSTTCNALLPTSFREYSDLSDNLPVVTALDWTIQLQKGVEPTPNLCFSLNLASLHYTLKTTTTHTCTRSDWVGPIQDERAIAVYHYRNNEWQSFLTPDSITKMMRLALKVNPSVCVAAYYVDYEDYQGMCKLNQTFPRLTAVRHVLDQVRTR